MLENVGMIVKTFLITILILILAYWCIKKLGKGFFLPNRMTKHMRMLEYLPMGQEKGIALVQISETYYLMGISQGGISLLKELSKDEISDCETKEELAFSAVLEKMNIQDFIKRGKKHE
ncbi:MAG: flagellar biosynthetic protein FliO [Clostridiales bacterium]|nr:flagellar biosynthetic protein FliO [Clostridiales bacterium]